MNVINYISAVAMPMIILLIVFNGLKEKISVFDIFLKGAKEGLEITIKIFPTLVGLFMAIGVLRSSGILDFIIKLLSPILNILKIPSEVIPLCLLRPISGSGSIAVATDIIKTYGVDTFIGIVAATIMGSTETTLYTIAVYSSSIGVKKTRFVLAAALIADITGMAVSLIVCRIMSYGFC